MLDRNRYYAIVYGDPVAKFYQDKIFYKGDGTPVDAKQPAKPAPKVEPTTQVVDQPSVDNAQQARIDKLNGMHISQLKKIAEQVADSTGTELPAGGAGAKARLVAYIANNTT